MIQDEEEKIFDIKESGETFGSLKRVNSRFGLVKKLGDDKEVYRVSIPPSQSCVSGTLGYPISIILKNDYLIKQNTYILLKLTFLRYNMKHHYHFARKIIRL